MGKFTDLYSVAAASFRALFFPKVASFLEFFRYSHPALRNQSSISPSRLVLLNWMEPSSASAASSLPQAEEFARTALVKLEPVIRRVRSSKSCYVNPWNLKALRMSRNLSSVIPVKIGIDGFGNMGMLLAEVALQSIDVEVVAINDHSISNTVMVSAWKSNNIDVILKDYTTLIFKKTCFAQSHEGKDPIKIFDNMEVVVFHIREQKDVPWSEVGAEYVLHSHGVYYDDKNMINNGRYNPRAAMLSASPDSCLRHLPKVIWAFGLNLDHPMARSNFNNADQLDSIRAACLNITTRSKSAAEGMRKILPEWDGTLTSRLFHAEASAMDMLDVNLTIRLQKAVRLENDNNRRLMSDSQSGDHLMAILSFCVDLMRYAPVGGCLLELL